MAPFYGMCVPGISIVVCINDGGHFTGIARE